MPPMSPERPHPPVSSHARQRRLHQCIACHRRCKAPNHIQDAAPPLPPPPGMPGRLPPPPPHAAHHATRTDPTSRRTLVATVAAQMFKTSHQTSPENIAQQRGRRILTCRSTSTRAYPRSLNGTTNRVEQHLHQPATMGLCLYEPKRSRFVWGILCRWIPNVSARARTASLANPA